MFAERQCVHGLSLSKFQLEAGGGVYIQLYFGGFRADSGIQRSTCFASRLNAKVKKFVSWRPDPEACAVDAFTFDWGTQLNYAFPPFS